MAIKITEDIIKEYAERNDLPTLYEKYKEIKSDKDLKKFQRENKFALQAIEGEQKGKRREERLAEIREKDPLSFGVTDEELVEAMPEDFTKIEAEDIELDYGVPKNLFIPKGNYTNKEWLSIMRQRFKNAGLDFDNLEDRRRAAEAQSKEESREGLREEAEKPGEGFAENKITRMMPEFIKEPSAKMSPRSLAKLQAGKQIESEDVASDIMRLAEAAPAPVAVPTIVGRNILEGVADEEEVEDVLGKTGVDISAYLTGSFGLGGAGRALRAAVSGPTGAVAKMGKNFFKNLVMASGEGSRGQVVKATKAALEGKPVSRTNPYAIGAKEMVEEADLTDNQKKTALGALNKYLKEGGLEKIEKKGETQMASRSLRSGKVLEKEINQRAEELGKEAVESTMSKKFSFDEIAERIPQEKADELLVSLQSKGLRTAKPVDVNGVSKFEKSYVGVEDLPQNAKEVGRDILESKVIEDYLKKNKDVLKKIYVSEAAQQVGQRYGSAPDPKLRGIFKFVAETPTAYEKPLSGKALKSGVRYLQVPVQRYGAGRFPLEKYSFEEEEK